MKVSHKRRFLIQEMPLNSRLNPKTSPETLPREPVYLAPCARGTQPVYFQGRSRLICPLV